jgi:hypothetical protein
MDGWIDRWIDGWMMDGLIDITPPTHSVTHTHSHSLTHPDDMLLVKYFQSPPRHCTAGALSGQLSAMPGQVESERTCSACVCV